MTTTTALATHLPTMQMHIEGTPELVATARHALIARGATVISAEGTWQGRGYAAIRTDLEDGVSQLVLQIEDPHYVTGGSVRLTCGYVGPMVNSVRLQTRHAQSVIELLTAAGALVDAVQAEPNWTTFRPDAAAKACKQVAAILDCQVSVDSIAQRWG